MRREFAVFACLLTVASCTEALEYDPAEVAAAHRLRPRSEASLSEEICMMRADADAASFDAIGVAAIAASAETRNRVYAGCMRERRTRAELSGSRPASR